MNLNVVGYGSDGLPVIVRGASSSSTIKAALGDASTGPSGRIVARLARLGVVDRDSDVLVSGLVGSGADVVISAWGHASWQPGFLPIGVGRVAEEGDALVLRGRLAMTTVAGAETFKMLRELGSLAEYSFGFNIPDGGAESGRFNGQLVRYLKQLLVYEASPVLKGASIGSGTIELAGLHPRQLAVASAAKENERQLLALRGWRQPSRTIVGFAPDGQPVRLRGAVGGSK